MSVTNVVLTGFMGTGKSTIGRLLARQLGYSFIDTDQLIETRIGQSIRDFFSQYGEAAFRKEEHRLVAEISQQERQVIATGGGLVLNPENVALLQKNAVIFCLTAPAGTILERISNQPGTRPLLQSADPLARIEELLAERQACYQQFEQISTTSVHLEELVTGLAKTTIDLQQGA